MILKNKVINIPDILRLHTELINEPAISKIWWSQTKEVDGTAWKHNAFYYYDRESYLPGYFYNWITDAIELKKFESTKQLEEEIASYRQGFYKGFLDYDGKAAATYLNKETIFGVIIKFLGKRPLPEVNSIKDSNGNILMQPIKWHDYGEMVGKFYNSWVIVLKNQNIFEPIFNNY